MSRHKATRREFLERATVGGAGLLLGGSTGCSQTQPTSTPTAERLPKPKYKSPNEKLNIACIGVGGRGAGNVERMRGENVVALCDVDHRWARKSFEKFPDAKPFHDFRVMFDQMHKEIDAVVVSTPDHMHAPATMMAMRRGMHVYCEKPLTHDVYEARVLAETAAKYNVATQMGNQGTSNSTFRRGVEAVRSGAIGKVTEVHVWTDRPQWPQGMARPEGSDPVPAHLKWDLWIGSAPMRPYVRNKYHPFVWRGWWDFGTGALGDMGCHTANMPFMALELGSPTSISAECSEFNKESFPTWSVITYDFPARRDLPPVTWTWYEGGINKPPKVIRKLASLIHGEAFSQSGSIMIGDKGALYSPHDYGGKWMLLPKDKFEGWKPPEQTLPDSPGHYREWIRACKGGKPAMSNFAYAGRLTETILLGNLALIAGKKILWDGPQCKVTNCPEADARVRREYRKGWTL
ncbi:MAG: Gfo/Idh/MocA family oxidoreductase [Phycisphaerae bacterium]|nr:Gfo/Idh/MocA family oxidoreductase [Phycisphaerae bacterium]